MNPAECETNYLQIAKNLEFYGMDKHPVMVNAMHRFICFFICCIFHRSVD